MVRSRLGGLLDANAIYYNLFSFYHCQQKTDLQSTCDISVLALGPRLIVWRFRFWLMMRDVTSFTIAYWKLTKINFSSHVDVDVEHILTFYI